MKLRKMNNNKIKKIMMKFFKIFQSERLHKIKIIKNQKMHQKKLITKNQLKNKRVKVDVVKFIDK